MDKFSLDQIRFSTYQYKRYLSSLPLPRRKFTNLALLVLTGFLCLNLFSGPSSSIGIHIHSPFHHARKIQHDFGSKSISRAQPNRLKAVRKEFVHAWNGYVDHSWMADALQSTSGGRKEQFCGWSATLIDSLDSLWIMGLTDEFEDAINATLTIDFAHNIHACSVNLFESTIRYLGGMLAAYDLSQDPRLLSKLAELGEMLHSAFATPNGMPCSDCHLGTSESNFFANTNVPLADVGSLYLEFARLSQLTGEEKYMYTVAHLTSVFASTQNGTSIPGLWPEYVDSSAIDGAVPMFARRADGYSLGALSDSAYEYLLKAHLLLGQITDLYSSMWFRASDAMKRYMFFKALIPGVNSTSDVLFSGIASRWASADVGESVILEPRIQHLGCFAGGLFAMSSRVFDAPSDLAIGKALTEGCIWAYDHTPLGIMPETVTLFPCPSDDFGPFSTQCEWNSTLWSEITSDPLNCQDGNCDSTRILPPGFIAVRDAKYLLRPEAIESIFILWRVTGDEYYRDVGWRIFNTIIQHTRTPFGHAALDSVLYLSNRAQWEGNREVVRQRPLLRDEMESFWLAETLKYFYLLFADVRVVDLDEFVLNTEAHPFRLSKNLRGF